MKNDLLIYLLLACMFLILFGEVSVGLFVTITTLYIPVAIVSIVTEFILGFIEISLCLKTIAINNKMCSIAKTAAQATGANDASRIARHLTQLSFPDPAFEYATTNVSYKDGVEHNSVVLNWKIKKGKILYVGKADGKY